MLPAFFIGHGSPMNAISDNEFTRTWKEIAAGFPRPKAILSISAHWETRGTQVTAMPDPRTIHDFYGFPEVLSQQTYPAPGSPELAERVRELIKSTPVISDLFTWGLDHGTWSVLKQMYPDASIPVVQLSLDRFKTKRQHLNLAEELIPLREEGILILCSGNIVHNLQVINWTTNGLEEEGYEWAVEFDSWVRKCLTGNEIDKLLNYTALGEIASLSVPSGEHFTPLIYLLGLKTDKDKFSFFSEKVLGGSLSMTCVVLS
jgi:4,5-DOPA dioxygenase extradiol